MQVWESSAGVLTSTSSCFILPSQCTFWDPSTAILPQCIVLLIKQVMALDLYIKQMYSKELHIRKILLYHLQQVYHDYLSFKFYIKLSIWKISVNLNLEFGYFPHWGVSADMGKYDNCCVHQSNSLKCIQSFVKDGIQCCQIGKALLLEIEPEFEIIELLAF